MKNPIQHPSRALRIGGVAAATLFLLTALPWQVTAQTPKKSPVLGTWVSKDISYSFNAKGEYVALFGDMDHQGTYRVEGRKVLLTPTVVAQRPAKQWLQDLAKDPSRLAPRDRRAGQSDRQALCPYPQW